jgi:hypothetical protein
MNSNRSIIFWRLPILILNVARFSPTLSGDLPSHCPAALPAVTTLQYVSIIGGEGMLHLTVD